VQQIQWVKNFYAKILIVTYLLFKLKNKPLARWLYLNYATHENPFPYSVEKIKYLTGSSDRKTANFKQSLELSLETLIEVTNWQWSIKDGKLECIKKAAADLKNDKIINFQNAKKQKTG
jgi:hypothetical protein